MKKFVFAVFFLISLSSLYGETQLELEKSIISHIVNFQYNDCNYLCDKYINIYSNNYFGYNAKGIINMYLYNLTEAIIYFNRALGKLNDSSDKGNKVAILKNLALINLTLKNYLLATNEYLECIKEKPSEKGYAYLGIAGIYCKISNYIQAKKYYLQALPFIIDKRLINVLYYGLSEVANETIRQPRDSSETTGTRGRPSS